jgi:ABC-type sugar transport system ATPase subunit
MVEMKTARSKSVKPILLLSDIQKSFGGIHALSGISFDLFPGEVHALVGENGAGKSTLIKIIAGAYTADSGVIELDGVKYLDFSPDQARELGIGIVYQEFTLLPELSVAENIFIAAQPLTPFGLIDMRTRNKRTVEILARLGAESHIAPNTLVKDLTVGEQQLVEIAKALATNARILIMDEPSAVLPSNDMDRLFGVIRSLRDEGRSIIYISHRLSEIFELADRVTVLKDGQTMATKEIAEVNNAGLVRLMVGREMTDMYPPHDNKIGTVVLTVHDLCIEGTVCDVNFDLREGEVLGLAGLGGSGRTTVARSLVGLAKVISGDIQYLGKSAPKNPAAAAEKGLVLIPEDRKAFGLVLNQSMRFNIALPNLQKFLSGIIIRDHVESDAVRQSIESVQIRPSTPEISTENLSGGNQQKVVLAKWLLTQPKVVVFDEPTRGIDVGAKAEIYQHIRELTHRRVGVIMASSDLPELLGMSDRILVFHEGRITGELSREEATEENIMRLATGIVSPEPVA